MVSTTYVVTEQNTFRQRIASMSTTIVEYDRLSLFGPIINKRLSQHSNRAKLSLDLLTLGYDVPSIADHRSHPLREIHVLR
jgi:hypothetical protein